MLRFTPVLVFVLLTGAVNGQNSTTALKGELRSNIAFSGRPYSVKGEITIPRDAVVSIDPGVVLHFDDFATLRVQGALKALGEADRPIVFTSKNDRPRSPVKPAPYDWSGIVVDSGARALFSHCKIAYSLFGIDAATDSIEVDSCTFLQNGRSDLLHKGVAMQAGAEPFTYRGAHATKPAKMIVDRNAQRGGLRPIVLGSSIAAGTVGGVLGVWGLVSYFHSSKRFNQLNDPTDPDNLRNPSIARDWEEAKRKRDRDVARSFTGLAFAALGGVGLVFTASF